MPNPALNQPTPTGFIVATVIIGIIFLIVFIFYCRSLYIALGAVPENQRRFPRWFIWMMLVPLVGYIFAWMMLPFGLPKSFTTAFKDNEAIVKKAGSLFRIGLAQVILILLGFIPYAGPVFSLTYFVLMIIYWVKAVKLGRLAKSLTSVQTTTSAPPSDG